MPDCSYSSDSEEEGQEHEGMLGMAIGSSRLNSSKTSKTELCTTSVMREK
jgi:hypothetical protein